MPEAPDTKLTDSRGSAKTVGDEIKDQPVGSVVDPAEVVPPVVPAQRGQRTWLKPLIIIFIVLIIAVIAVFGL